MTADDWDCRFEQLFTLFLVDTKGDFWDDVLPFDSPEELEEKFEFLETQNLFYISRL